VAAGEGEARIDTQFLLDEIFCINSNYWNRFCILELLSVEQRANNTPEEAHRQSAPPLEETP
jgi:hypothetical protein